MTSDAADLLTVRLTEWTTEQPTIDRLLDWLTAVRPVFYEKYRTYYSEMLTTREGSLFPTSPTYVRTCAGLQTAHVHMYSNCLAVQCGMLIADCYTLTVNRSQNAWMTVTFNRFQITIHQSTDWNPSLGVSLLVSFFVGIGRIVCWDRSCYTFVFISDFCQLFTCSCVVLRAHTHTHTHTHALFRKLIYVLLVPSHPVKRFSSYKK